MHFAATPPQQMPHGFPSGMMVIHDEDTKAPERHAGRIRATGRDRRTLFAAAVARQFDSERGASAATLAARPDTSVVQFENHSGQRQPEAESTERAIASRVVTLHEWVKGSRDLRSEE